MKTCKIERLLVSCFLVDLVIFLVIAFLSFNWCCMRPSTLSITQFILLQLKKATKEAYQTDPSYLSFRVVKDQLEGVTTF